MDCIGAKPRCWAGRLACVAMLALGSPTSAVPLPIGIEVPLAGTSQAEEPAIGPPIEDWLLSGFSLADPASGELLLRGAVGLGMSQSPLDLRLRLHFRIDSFEDLVGAGFRVEALVTAPAFGDADEPVDADFRTDAPGAVAPTHARHDAETLPWQVIFRFGEPLSAGLDSRTMVLRTNDDMAFFGGYGAYLVVADAAGQRYELPFASYITLIPEPASAWLLAAGLAGLAGLGRRRGGGWPDR